MLADPETDLTLIEPYGVPYLGGVDRLESLPETVGYIIGIGAVEVRAAIDGQHRTRACPVLVHPSATRGRAVELGPGTVVCAGVRLSNHIRLGRHVHVNLNATIGHDTTLGNYVSISPLAAVSGG